MAEEFDYESFLNFLPPIPRGPPSTAEELQKTPPLVVPQELKQTVTGGGINIKKTFDAFLKAYAEGNREQVSLLADSLIANILHMSRR